MTHQLYMMPPSTTSLQSRRLSDISNNDPFTKIMRPPKNETTSQRQIRLKDEQLARKRSDQIDKLIKDESIQAQKDRRFEKTILLLGGFINSGK
jgi:hypothetical protein